jgi:hypothetical protein
LYDRESRHPARETPSLHIVSEADEIDYCLAEFGESPEELDPDCWRVELRGIVRNDEGSDEERVLKQWRCFGGPENVARQVEQLLPLLLPK